MENKKVLVTGGNRGIGKGIVEGFLNNGNEVLAIPYGESVKKIRWIPDCNDG